VAFLRYLIGVLVVYEFFGVSVGFDFVIVLETLQEKHYAM
jgi:hypothetical protein